MINKIKNYIKQRKLILLVTLIYTLVVLTVLLNRFWQYEAFYYDHGMMESTAYQVSQFKIPLHHRQSGKVPIYVDHLYPSMQLVLAPFYWFWNSYETPIVVMSVFTGLSVLVGYEIASTLTKNKPMIYALLFAYMFYIGMQNALIFFVHDVTIQILFLMLLFWSVVKYKFKLYYLLLILNLGFKETFSLTGIALGISLLFLSKWRRHALLTIGISLIYGLLAAKVIIPYFRYISFGAHSNYNYMYTPQLSINIFDYLPRFLDTAQKQETIFVSLSSFGFLPLFSPFSLPLVAQDFAQRFVIFQPESTLRAGLNLYYSANLVVIMFVGSVFALKILERFKWYKKIINIHAISIILFIVYYHQFKYHGPLGLIYNRDFFKITKNMKFMDDFVKKIPSKGKVMTQNNLATRFTHTDLYLFLDEKTFYKVDPDVLAIDFRPGQSPNNFFPLHEPELEVLAKKLEKDPKYKVLYKDYYRYIITKKEYEEN